MLKYCLMLAALLQGCGSEPGQAPDYRDSPELRKEIAAFYALLNDAGIARPATAADLRVIELDSAVPAPMAAFCQHYRADQARWAEVKIKTGLGPMQTKALVFHEMTHCLFAAKHWDFSLHIMNAHLPEEQQLARWWPDLERDFIKYLTQINAGNRI